MRNRPRLNQRIDAFRVRRSEERQRDLRCRELLLRRALRGVDAVQLTDVIGHLLRRDRLAVPDVLQPITLHRLCPSLILLSKLPRLLVMCYNS